MKRAAALGWACALAGLGALAALGPSAAAAQPPQAGAVAPLPQAGAAVQPRAGSDRLALPPPRHTGAMPLERALHQRRSVRAFAATPLTLAQAGQLLWAAQGESAAGRRTTPSAGATYPLTLILVVGAVDGVAAGSWRYQPEDHSLQRVAEGDARQAIAAAARGQGWMAQAPALVLIAAQPARTAARYGARAERYVAIEAGAAMQNLLLQAGALGLAGTPVGAFDEAALRRALPLAAGEQPLLAVPVGSPR